MKNIIIILFLIIGGFYFFVPHNTQIDLLEKLGIDSSFLGEKEKEISNLEGGVVQLNFNEEHKAIYEGNISDGEIMSDLSWASGNFVKCFDENEYDKFSGNILMHRVLLGKNKNVSVKLSGQESENLSIFVYKTDALSKVYPPEKEYTHDCKINTVAGLNKNIDMTGNTITSDIVVGVAGPKGITEGGYTLEIIEK